MSEILETSPPLTFADRMSIAARRAGVAKAQLAADIGVAPNTLSTWLGGRFRPAAPTLKLFAMRCGVSYEWLRDGTAVDQHWETLRSLGVLDHLASNNHAIDRDCAVCEAIRNAQTAPAVADAAGECAIRDLNPEPAD